MIRTYVFCPYCGKKKSISVMTAHVKNEHNARSAEWKNNIVKFRRRSWKEQTTTGKVITGIDAKYANIKNKDIIKEIRGTVTLSTSGASQPAASIKVISGKEADDFVLEVYTDSFATEEAARTVAKERGFTSIYKLEDDEFDVEQAAVGEISVDAAVELVPEVVQESELTPEPEKKTDFVDEKLGFDFEQHDVKVPKETIEFAGKEVTTEKKPVAKTEPQNEILGYDETFVFIKSLAVLPAAFLPEIPVRTDEQLKPFSKELAIYCNKKGINIRDYFFDELGIVVTGTALAAGYYADWKVHYGGKKKKESVESKKLDADYEHQKEIDKQNEKRDVKK